MLLTLVIVNLVIFNEAIDGFKITSRVDSTVEPDSIVPRGPYQRDLDSPYADHHTSYEAVFVGARRPINVDCSQPDVICKFPLVVSDKNDKSAKPVKLVNEVPVIRGTQSASETETREDLSRKEEVIADTETEAKVPIFRGAPDSESLTSDGKDIEETWILEKNIHNKKYQIPVRLVPSKTAPTYPAHDFHDHYGGEEYFHYPAYRHGSGWTPWMRAHPSVYNYPSQPCQPPVYHSPPPPCSPAYRPTKKPTINIDDKIDKEDD